MYAVGNNLDVSKHVGIEVNRVRVLMFGIAGFTYSIAGLVSSSTLGCFMVGFGDEYQLSALIAVLLGMSFLSLRIPNIKGTLISVLLMSILVNAFTMLNLPFYIKGITEGIVLVFAIGSLGLRKRIRSSSEKT
jgi:ribose transport system permease protein